MGYKSQFEGSIWTQTDRRGCGEQTLTYEGTRGTHRTKIQPTVGPS